MSLKNRFLEPAGSEDKCIGQILLACLRNKEQQCLIPPLLRALGVSSLLSFSSSDGVLPDLHFGFSPVWRDLCFPKLSYPILSVVGSVRITFSWRLGLGTHTSFSSLRENRGSFLPRGAGEDCGLNSIGGDFRCCLIPGVLKGIRGGAPCYRWQWYLSNF